MKKIASHGRSVDEGCNRFSSHNQRPQGCDDKASVLFFICFLKPSHLCMQDLNFYFFSYSFINLDRRRYAINPWLRDQGPLCLVNNFYFLY